MHLRTAARRASFRLRHALRPALSVTPPPTDVVVQRDVSVPMRDGVELRANVHLPAGAGPHPAIVCAHPYGKDRLPRQDRRGRYHPPGQVRALPQSEPYQISALTSWEAPDPAHWTARGYVVVNADLRGWFRSGGTSAEPISEQEGRDGHDLVEWVATQPWCNGQVGMSGVSYLALVQWATASERPPHLGAICVWEGFTDAYRDLLRPGGIREDGFVRMWTAVLRRASGRRVDIRRQQRARPLWDEWWAARVRAIERIDAPALVCGSFSDHNLHSGGSFDGFARIGSTQRWLYTHRGPKWATYYGAEALEFQGDFFDHFLRDEDNGFAERPPVRVEVREDAATVTEVREEDAWPLHRTDWQRWHLDAGSGTLVAEPPGQAGAVAFHTRRGRAAFRHAFATETEVTGPMALRLVLEADDVDDVCVFAGIRKRRGGQPVGFEGSYGFTDALVTCGWLRASHRETDPARSLPWRPHHPHTTMAPLRRGEPVVLEIGLLPSATLFRAGEELELVVQGRWFFPGNPLVGQFPALYERSPAGTARLLTGGAHRPSLLVPVIP